MAASDDPSWIQALARYSRLRHPEKGTRWEEEQLGLMLDALDALFDRAYTEWFNLPVLPAITVAGVPGTPSDAAMAWYGRIHIPHDSFLSAIHLHLDVDGTGAS